MLLLIVATKSEVISKNEIHGFQLAFIPLRASRVHPSSALSEH